MRLPEFNRRASNGLWKFYSRFVSPAVHALLGAGYGCRFEPTCSAFMREAIVARGWIAGTGLGIKRVCRCHPWGGSGYDPVPILERERC